MNQNDMKAMNPQIKPAYYGGWDPEDAAAVGLVSGSCRQEPDAFAPTPCWSRQCEKIASGAQNAKTPVEKRIWCYRLDDAIHERWLQVHFRDGFFGSAAYMRLRATIERANQSIMDDRYDDAIKYLSAAYEILTKVGGPSV